MFQFSPLHRPPPRELPRARAPNYSAPISSCRGGMGEAHGDPPRHPRQASTGARGPNGVLNNYNTLSPALLFGDTREASTGPPPPGPSGTRKSLTKITFSDITYVISRMPEIIRRCTGRLRQNAPFTVNICIFASAVQKCLYVLYESCNSPVEIVFYCK